MKGVAGQRDSVCTHLQDLKSYTAEVFPYCALHWTNIMTGTQPFKEERVNHAGTECCTNELLR